MDDIFVKAYGNFKAANYANDQISWRRSSSRTGANQSVYDKLVQLREFGESQLVHFYEQDPQRKAGQMFGT